jgi:BMFP domain-containing protein YqiC
MPKLDQNPYLVSFTTAFGSKEEEENFFQHHDILLFLLANKFSTEDIHYILQIGIELTEDLFLVTDEDINQLQKVSKEGLSRFKEIVLWARNNKERLIRRITALNRLTQRLKDVDKQLQKKTEK